MVSGSVVLLRVTVVVVLVVTVVFLLLFVLALFLRLFFLNRRSVFFLGLFLLRNVTGGTDGGGNRSGSIERLGSGDCSAGTERSAGCSANGVRQQSA